MLNKQMLDTLKQYKELIVVIVFFLSGFIWLDRQFDRFPTKVDLQVEVTTLNCLLEKYMTLTQLQIHSRDLEKKLAELAEDISKMELAESSLSPAMKLEFEGMKSDHSDLREQLKTNTAEMGKIWDELARNVCKKR